MLEGKLKLTDKQLWEEFVDGNDEAFHSIYDSYLQLLFKFGLHFSNDEALIQDCIQDIFIDLHKYRKKLKKTDNIKLYLYISLKRKIIKTLVKESKIKKINIEDQPFSYNLSSVEEADNELSDMKIEMLEKALSELSNRQREAIYLRFVSELSYDEICQVLQMNYQSARNLIYRGIEKLRESCRHNSLLLLFFIQFYQLPSSFQ